MASVNYGLKGGMLDSTKYVEAAVKRLCYPSEVDARRRMLERLEIMTVADPSRRDAAAGN